MNTALELVSVHFDGGSINRPQKRLAYGSFETIGEGWSHKVLRQDFGWPITSNQAEYLSLIAALDFLRTRVDPSETRLEIFSDSELLVRQINRQYRIKHHHLIPLANRVREELDYYAEWVVSWHRRNHNVKRFGH